MATFPAFHLTPPRSAPTQQYQKYTRVCSTDTSKSWSGSSCFAPLWTWKNFQTQETARFTISLNDNYYYKFFQTKPVLQAGIGNISSRFKPEPVPFIASCLVEPYLVTSSYHHKPHAKLLTWSKLNRRGDKNGSKCNRIIGGHNEEANVL